MAVSTAGSGASPASAPTTAAAVAGPKPGTAATIATRLAEQQISLESIVQRHRGPEGGKDAKAVSGPVPVILITYATTEDAVRRALAAVKADKVITGEPQLIRIEML